MDILSADRKRTGIGWKKSGNYDIKWMNEEQCASLPDQLDHNRESRIGRSLPGNCKLLLIAFVR